SRKILSKDKTFSWKNILEPHDSFYIGSDVFYTYIVQNGLWKLRMEQKTKDGYLKIAEHLRKALLDGQFPEEIKEQLMQMIEYFGQSPIIVRSSSLLEDSFGNAFAGKYESIFSVNQGTAEERLNKLEEYIKRIFASTMNEDALSYRLQRGLDMADEQMALLVQRVSGSYHKNYFFPDVAGVGISYNTFAWNEKMDPKAGMLRIVFGLGTRAVNRVEDDYPRVAALDDPLSRPYHDSKYLKRFSQHKVDILNISSNNLETLDVSKILEELPETKNKLFGNEDTIAREKMKELKIKGESAWNLNFDGLFSETDFKDIISKMLKNLEKEYQYPVDIEFTVNFKTDGTYFINLLQCRPLQVRGIGKKISIPSNISKEKILFETKGNFMGGNIAQKIWKIFYVNPQKYHNLPEKEKYSLARLIGKFNKTISDKERNAVILVGPGRWGTSTPSLGVPVNFSEINNISLLVEIDYESGNIQPELSFGTHFFQDLVETDISYAAVFSGVDKGYFNEKFLSNYNNVSKKYFPDQAVLNEAIEIYEFEKTNLQVLSDVVSQKMICFLG
ncbi:MAG: PEP/pyruvate-binding domain-containing protein, partial [Elusimicrobia bacterium]|nr:PEP/pyruvate-binding domain-containing protein [Elusimicrobiota bacterium]